MSKKHRARKCQTMEEVVNSQREALKITIAEAKANEKIRNQMLRDAPSAERIEELKYRHHKERLKEQEKISQLIDDISSVQSNGNRQSLNAPIGPKKLDTMHKDRFETAHLHHSYKDIFNKFDAIDTRANQVASERYNEYKEKKTLALLQSKRECLNKLVSIQKQALHGKTFDAGSLSTGRSRSTTNSRSSDTSSVASYATFNAPATETKEVLQRRNVGKNVPKLF